MPTFPRAKPARPSKPSVSRFVAACGLAVLPGTAFAQTAPVDAAQLQSQLRTWFSTILVPAVTLPELPLVVTRDGDKFVLTLPASLWSGTPGQDVTADLRQVEGGAWAIDKMNIPAKGAIKSDALAAANPALDGEASYEFGQQSIRAVIDPAMQRRSTMAVELKNFVLDIRAEGQKQSQRLDSYTWQGAVVPGADGRFDVIQEGTMSGWVTSAEVGAGMSTDMAIRRARIGMRLEGVRSDRLGSAFLTVKELVALALNDGTLGNGAMPPKEGATPPKDAPDPMVVGRQKLRTLIESFRDMAQRLEGEETVDDLTMTLPLVGKISLAQMQWSMGGEAPDGRLRAWTEFSLRGLGADAIPPSMRDFVPSHVSMRPVISGVQTEKLFSLLLRATEEDPDMAALEAEAMALLTSADTVIGMDSLAIDLHPVRVTGTGRLRVFNKDKAGVEARLSASGFDALIADANKKPALRQAAPFLVIAKGLGRQEGDKLVWDIVVSESQALVNGVDVLAMQAPPEQKPQPQQRPNRR